jgi:hypothetical protein
MAVVELRYAAEMIEAIDIQSKQEGWKFSYDL